MNIAELLHRTARRSPERPALALGRTVLANYGEYGAHVAALAYALRHKFSLDPGDRVALVMANCPQYLEVMFAAWHAGLVAVPINAKLHPREFEYILDHSGARLCFVTAKLADAISPLVETVAGLEAMVSVDDSEYRQFVAGETVTTAAVAPDDAAWLFYTSGTTGRPKGAILSHRNLHMMTLSYLADLDRIADRDAIIHAAPKSHGSGIYSLPHVARGAVQVAPESGGFEPAEIVDLIDGYPGATFFFAPTMVVRLMNSAVAANADFANLKSIIYGGGPMYAADTVKALACFGPKLIQIYGQGESPMTITYLSLEAHLDRDHPRYMHRLASVGVERTDVEVRVVDPEDRPLPPDEVGEIIVRGDVVMKGYWRNPEATRNALRDGWLYTGDMGSFDGDGFLTLKDRSKDVIISGGSNIYPREVEEALLLHPGVLEASVVGRPHPEWGEDVVAFVVARPGEEVTEAALDRLCLDNIARFKRPKSYRFVDDLPKNNYGKVVKTELRKHLEPAGEDGG
ncbi:MAG: long-chain fatty acid--CoA ligase [Alphaproteobacteria bacterium]|nr:long-chain fatty acid--CoA ligase [Alphaproteobacteria bacterium]